MADTERMQLVKKLQAMGVDVNPNAATKTLVKKLQEAELSTSGQPVGGPVGNQPTDPIVPPVLQESEPNSDMQKLLNMMSTVVKQVDGMDKRLKSVESNGKGDFKLSVKESDVKSAEESKVGVDERIVRIVEDVLGVDFGVEITPNPNGPGFQFSVLVPERLSEIRRSTRPIPDPETGKYKLDPKTNQVVEEEYWPGDKRSRTVGSTDSFDVIRDQCNRVRAYIVSYYEKNKKPLPEFKLR